MTLFKLVALGIGLGILPLAQAAETGSRAVRIHIALSQAAQAKLGDAGERVTVASYWYGAPKPAFAAKADEVGQIQAASRIDGISAKGGQLTLDPGPASAAAWSWIEDPVSLNVNVYSSRKRFDDNLLACDFIDGPVTELDEGLVRIECALITENIATRHFPASTTAPE